MNNTSEMDCGARIKLERQKRSWTQEQLAERAGLAARTVQRIEAGADASLETLRLVAEAFGIPSSELVPRKARVHFGAPADRRILWATTSITVLGIVLLLAGQIPSLHALGNTGIFLVCVVFFASFLTVSGYSIRNGNLVVHRLGWSRKFPLSKLVGVEVNPLAMAGALRLFGLGGLIAYTGWYRNSVMGNFLVFARNGKNCVVLEFENRKVVVAPDDPEAFADSLREAAKGVCAEGK